MIYAKKSLGQNFLTDKNIIKKILDLVNIKNKNIVEIGPGTGALTNEILKRKPASLNLIEKDAELANHLKIKHSSNKFVKVFNQDILKYDIEKLNKKNTVFFGNLPFNISSQILVKIIKLNKQSSSYSDVIFMFQKELGNKILGKFKSKNYSRLSILTNYRFKIVNKFLISPNCFFPKPKVDSIIIHFKPKDEKKTQIKKIENLEKITKILFSNKRKMINKNIKKILRSNEIKTIDGLKLNLRPSELSPEVFYKITELYERR